VSAPNAANKKMEFVEIVNIIILKTKNCLGILVKFVVVDATAPLKKQRKYGHFCNMEAKMVAWLLS
jgi:hypothetical protein